MAVFSKSKDKTKQEKKGTDTDGGVELSSDVKKSHLEDVIVRPRITEKATEEAERGVYVFEVFCDTNKSLVSEAVRYLYSVTPEKVNIVNQQPREVTRFGRKGKRKGMKKAYVYLKEGDEIEVV